MLKNFDLSLIVVY